MLDVHRLFDVAETIRLGCAEELGKVDAASLSRDRANRPHGITWTGVIIRLSEV